MPFVKQSQEEGKEGQKQTCRKEALSAYLWSLVGMLPCVLWLVVVPSGTQALENVEFAAANVRALFANWLLVCSHGG